MELNCVVERITYQNPDNGYSIFKARTDDRLITIVGTLASLSIGASLRVVGEWKTHPKYGEQFAAQTCEETVPATLDGIEAYLGSGMIKGIGPVYAKKIVSKFGLATLDIIEKQPERLSEVKGIGKAKIQKIAASWKEQHEVQNIMLFLQGHGVSPSLAVKIYKQYGENSVSVVKENPYRLADDVWGIGFKSADTIAKNIGLENDNPFRIESGIVYALGEFAAEGHVYATEEQLVQKASEMLELQPDKIDAVLAELTRKAKLIQEGNAIYLSKYYYAERGTASKLRELADAPAKTWNTDISAIERKLQLTYDDTQRDAIRTAAASKIMILTGLPGTGKTTTVQGIIENFESARMHVRLAAPTGRAAKRMAEATGREAKTIHRLLEFSPADGFTRNEDNPLEGDVLIVDECSMIDLLLMYALVKAIPAGMRLVLVGDVNQLPSVGAGNVLNDIIASEMFPVVRLTRIFRQAAESRIITNSHLINAGQMPDLSNQSNTDFWFIEKEDPNDIAKEIIALASERLPKYCGVSPKDIQILTPMKRGVIGTDEMNRVLQDTLNPGTMCLKQGGREFRRRDRVMQIRNNYDKDVFNGDVGIVEEVNLEDRNLIINFDGVHVPYEFSELDELVHAYAITIHKSQGSEYPIVIMPVSMQHYIMLERNLVYTGITRAKKMIVLVGTKKAVGHAVRNLKVSKRNTRLDERLRAE